MTDGRTDRLNHGPLIRWLNTNLCACIEIPNPAGKKTHIEKPLWLYMFVPNSD